MSTTNKNPGPELESLIKGTVDTFPPEARAKMGLRITKQENPVVVTPDEPDGQLIESRVEQTRTDERLKTNTELTGDINDNLPFKVKLPDGQTGFGVRSFPVEGSTLIVNALTEEASQRNMGNGRLDQTVIVRPTNLELPEYVKEIPDAVPEEFKVLVPVESAETTVEGNAVEPTLYTGELMRREHQLDKFLKRVYVRFRSLVGLPMTLSGSRMFEGIEATVDKTLATGAQTVSPNYLTVDGEVRNTGAGTTVKEKITVSAYPDQPGQLLDRQHAIVLPFTQKTVALGTNQGDANTEITPRDYANQRFGCLTRPH
jgi:hypothetical protein